MLPGHPRIQAVLGMMNRQPAHSPPGDSRSLLPERQSQPPNESAEYRRDARGRLLSQQNLPAFESSRYLPPPRINHALAYLAELNHPDLAAIAVTRVQNTIERSEWAGSLHEIRMDLTTAQDKGLSAGPDSALLCKCEESSHSDLLPSVEDFDGLS